MISKQYLAGFVDGEGYISVVTHKDIRTKRKYTIQPIINISGSNQEIMKALRETTKRIIRIKQKQKNCKLVYDIQIQDIDGIIDLLERIIPHILIKKEQCTLLMEYCKSRKKNLNKGYNKRELEIAEIFKTINKRGESC